MTRCVERCGRSDRCVVIRGVLIGLLMLAAAAVLTWTTSGRVYEVPASGPEREVVHPTGLKLLAPQHASVQQTEQGFDAELDPTGRSPERAELVWEREACDAVPPKVQTVGNGAAGPAYAMATRRPLAGGCLTLVAQERREFGQPAFSLGLRMFQTARMDKPSTARPAGS